MKEEIQVRISEEELIAKIKEIAQQINDVFSVEVYFLPVNWQNILQCRLPWIL